MNRIVVARQSKAGRKIPNEILTIFQDARPHIQSTCIIITRVCILSRRQACTVIAKLCNCNFKT